MDGRPARQDAEPHGEGERLGLPWQLEPGNHTEGEDRHSRDENRREEVYDLVRPRRDDIFLDQHFDPIGDGLKKTERPDAIWPVAVLHSPQNFSF